MKTFGKLIHDYRQSPHFMRLDDKSKAQYNRNFDRLLSMGADQPMMDGAMPNDVARSRSRVTLSRFWWESINNFEVNDEEASGTVKNMLLTCLKIPYRWAVVGDFSITANENPVRDIPRWDVTQKPTNPYTIGEIAMVKKAVMEGLYDDDLEPYAVLKVFMFHCGCRPEEAFDHEFTDFATKRGELLFQIYGAKHREDGVPSREVIMGKEEKWALEYFKNQPVFDIDQGQDNVKDNHLDNSKYTFRTDKGKKFSKVYNFWQQKRVDEVAGIQGEHTFYDLRRGLATAMYERKVELRVIADRLGHKDTETTLRYIVLNATGRSLSSKYRGLTAP